MAYVSKGLVIAQIPAHNFASHDIKTTGRVMNASSRFCFVNQSQKKVPASSISAPQ